MASLPYCALAFAFVVGSSLGACARPSTSAAPTDSALDSTGLPVGPVSETFVRSRPEAQLVYPGSQTVWPFWNGELSNYPDSGKSSAFAGAVLASTDSADQIYAWYQSWLTGHGWTTTPFLRAAGQPSIQGYKRGDRELFSVAMDDPTAISRTIGQPVPADRNIFEFRYMIEPAS